MPKSNLYWLLATVLLITASAQAQQAAKMPRIGYLAGTGSAPSQPFLQGLRDLGYVEGKNIAIEFRTMEGQLEAAPNLAAELVGLKVDVIVVEVTRAIMGAQKATSTIPIVMMDSTDPVGTGFVASLARPGRNITGLSDVGAELTGKRLELLKEIVVKLSRLGFLWSPTYPDADYELKEIETVARPFRLRIQSLGVKGPENFEEAFQAATKKRAEALMVGSGTFLAFHQKLIVELAAKSRLPAMYTNTRYVESAGGLMTYAYDRPYQFRRAAEYVDKILKGAKPGDLPVERPKRFELVINLKAAKQVGLTIPPNGLVRADRVIK